MLKLVSITFSKMLFFPQPLRRIHLGFNIIPIKFLPSLQQNFTHTRCSSSSFIVTLSLIRRTACARAQFSGCGSKINAHGETGQTAVCSQNLTLGVLSSRSALSLLVGALFKQFGLFLNTPRNISCTIFIFCATASPVGHGLLIHDVSRSHTTTHHIP